jgi:hypothetical protein
MSNFVHINANCLATLAVGRSASVQDRTITPR